jgi:hypothetical protein
MPKFARRWIAPLAAVSLVATMGMFSSAQGAAPKPTTTTSAQTTTTAPPPAQQVLGVPHYVPASATVPAGGTLAVDMPCNSNERGLSGGFFVESPDVWVSRSEPRWLPLHPYNGWVLVFHNNSSTEQLVGGTVTCAPVLEDQR